MSEGQDVSLATQGALLADLLEHWQLAHPHRVAHDYRGAVALRAHLLHCARYRTLTLVDVVALAPWVLPARPGQLVGTRANSASASRSLVGAYITGAAHRPLAGEHLDMLVGPWLGAEGQAAFYRQIEQADQR